MTMELNKREIAIVAITKNGIEIAKKLKNEFGNLPSASTVDIFVPSKFPNTDLSIIYFQEPVAQKIRLYFFKLSFLNSHFFFGCGN